MGWYDQTKRRVRDLPSAGFRIVLELDVRRVTCRACGTVKRERLDFLADNPRFTKRPSVPMKVRHQTPVAGKPRFVTSPRG
jgi:hypothetical protein